MSDPAADSLGCTDGAPSPATAQRPDAAPHVDLDGFAGPMDALLDLVRRGRVDLGRISILALVEQFGAALDQASRRVPLERQAEWVLTASWLVLLKTRLLLPVSRADAETAEREAAHAVRLLEQRHLMQAAVRWLEARPQLGQDVFARGVTKSRQPRRAGFVALLEAGLIVFRGPDGRPEDAVYRPLVPRYWRMSDALVRVRTLLPAFPHGRALGGFLPAIGDDAPDRALRVRAAVAGTFLAGLELARVGTLTLHQEAEFTPITMRAAIAVAPGDASERPS